MKKQPRLQWVRFLRSECDINLKYLFHFYAIGSIPSLLIENNSLTSFRIVALWLIIKIVAVLIAHLLWQRAKEFSIGRHRTRIIDLIFIGGFGAGASGLFVHIMALSFQLDSDTPLVRRVASTSLVGALWLPIMSYSNNSLSSFKSRESEMLQRLISQDLLKFKQSQVFEFLTSSFYRSIQAKLSVTSLEAREILDRKLKDSSSRDQLPEIVTQIATLSFRELSHSLQGEFEIANHLNDGATNPTFWERVRRSIRLETLFKSTPVLDPVPFAVATSFFCVGYIARHTTIVMAGFGGLLIFLTNVIILRLHVLAAETSSLNHKFLTFTSVISTALIPSFVLSTFNDYSIFGFSFQESKLYFLSYLILSLVMSFSGYLAVLIRLTFHEMELSLQNQFRDGVDKEQIVNTEITRITNICAKYIHGNLQSSLITLSKNLELAMSHNETEKMDQIIDDILDLLRDPELKLDRPVGTIEEEIQAKCGLWSGLVDIHQVMALGRAEFTPHQIIQVSDCIEELIANAVRHGKASAIELSVKVTGDGNLVLTSTDNGTFEGMPTDGLGFKIYQEVSNGDWTIGRSAEDNLTIVRILMSSR